MEATFLVTEPPVSEIDPERSGAALPGCGEVDPLQIGSGG